MAPFEDASGNVNHYCGIIQSILKLNYRHFFVYVLFVKWFKDVVTQGVDMSVRYHVIGFLQIDSTWFCVSRESPYILPVQCEQVAFQPMASSPNWWYVIPMESRHKAFDACTDDNSLVQEDSPAHDETNREDLIESDDEETSDLCVDLDISMDDDDLDLLLRLRSYR